MTSLDYSRCVSPWPPPRKARFFPFAAWAGLTTMGQKYPLGRPKNGISGNEPRLFHHSGHAKGVLYWWNRGNRHAKGPQATYEQLRAVRDEWAALRFKTRLDEIDASIEAYLSSKTALQSNMTAGFGRKTKGVTSPPTPVKNCLYVKTKSGHTIVSDALYAKWCYP